MSFIDSKGRLFGMISLIDLLIVLVIFSAAAGIYIKYFAKSGPGEELSRKVQYDVEIKAQTKEFADVIKVGDEIRESIKGNYLGKVVKKQVLPATDVTKNLEKGKFEKVEIPNAYDVILTLEANGAVTPDSILAEGVEIKVGQRLYVKGKGYAGASFIIGIRYEQQ
ncbi:MAG: hypothetical protein PWR27_484 [Petroclostridium sp.]|jgi:hypothetical protein|uniref:DUF4330 domain-containing protein n=1 Tax=Petroclostridium xylanilyticum TaxID=1792311 RepID=UPI000B9834CD|nr:DUF4330 domain-containing protein [Petroclostridium xylanilyticum]MBZ4645599.1 Uncharacterized protein [Clostridia bacterium]MDK2809775.1 hypothetical protein [Petroclostridium sp.]